MLCKLEALQDYLTQEKSLHNQVLPPWHDVLNVFGFPVGFWQGPSAKALQEIKLLWDERQAVSKRQLGRDAESTARTGQLPYRHQLNRLGFLLMDKEINKQKKKRGRAQKAMGQSPGIKSYQNRAVDKKLWNIYPLGHRCWEEEYMRRNIGAVCPSPYVFSPWHLLLVTTGAWVPASLGLFCSCPVCSEQKS